jgi:hypothetical protein
MTNQEINILAQEIAEKTQWDGLEISKIFLEALTDANFHSLRKQLEIIINKEFDL